MPVQQPFGALSCRPQDPVLKVSRRTLANMLGWFGLSAPTSSIKTENEKNDHTGLTPYFARELRLATKRARNTI